MYLFNLAGAIGNIIDSVFYGVVLMKVLIVPSLLLFR